eukprot:scaffold1669_cov108-Isochrysis_galbana.AAC.13
MRGQMQPRPRRMRATASGGTSRKMCGSAGMSLKLRRMEKRCQGSVSSKAISTPSWMTMGTHPTSTAWGGHSKVGDALHDDGHASH